ncbi:uncharacterized protein I303_108126 [Kwoniella dejecticola CBS 10117]|uniref:Glycosyl transferase CAP10 domain-containing protein n=1 Tax=Kwoniella dejecticola CBS 10117 TaxID=1296121 RepID=A0A1A5ZY94_9TREE|nr:uncharacterized protein I303_07547 [Kwoniella dejecticola CBS 10117]OBR82779.1 hypothetical protein I303_07547 [Kwoniella dejecticola CBS 10117]
MFDTRRKSLTTLLEEAVPVQSKSLLSPEERHRIQLETYQLDPIKATRLNERVKSPLADSPAHFDDSYDDSGKSKRSGVTPTFRVPRYRLLKLWRQILSILTVAGTVLVFLQDPAVSGSRIKGWNQWPQVSRTELSLRGQRRMSQRIRSKDGTSMIGDHSARFGVVKVNPDSSVHPIRLLIDDSERQWTEKVAKQSKTLKEAADEYHRRYKRSPPKGFEKWWAYVVEHNVPLPDEYDQIQRDLAPFYSVSPNKLNKRIEQASKSSGTFTLKVAGGNVESYHEYDSKIVESGEQRPQHQIELIQPIAHHLPDMTIVMSVSDTPQNMLSWHHRSELLNRDDQDDFFDDDKSSDGVNGFAWACPISSPLFNAARHKKKESKSGLHDLSAKSFVSDLREYMNICNHPELLEQHGLLIGKNPPMESPSPVFSLSKTALHADILGVPTEQWVEGGLVPAWKDRKNDKILWRGSNTAMHHDKTVSFENSQRLRLVNLTNYGGNGDLVTLSPNVGEQSLRDGATVAHWKGINEDQMDITFTGKPLQCDRNDGTCDKIARNYPFSNKRMGHDEAAQYKYVIDVDGNAWSARFNRLLTSGSLIMKATIMPEWYSDRIQPWVHFVPLKMDFTDLYDVVAFFRPSLTNPHAEDRLASRIASAGREWALTHWRREDMTAYMFRLYLEWARLIAEDRKSMDFVYNVDMESRRV